MQSSTSPPPLRDSSKAASRPTRASSSSITSPPRTSLWARCPRRTAIILERFFDESGGMQLVIHCAVRQPHQPRMGTGAAQALLRQVQFRAAGRGDRGRDRAVAVDQPQLRAGRRRSLSAFEAPCVRLLIQAMLDAPMFAARWRWIAGTSLALPRFRGGKKMPAPLQRMRAEDLMAAVFPDQIACAENIVGDREIPDHPLVRAGDPRLPVRGDGHRRARTRCCADIEAGDDRRSSRAT